LSGDWLWKLELKEEEDETHKPSLSLWEFRQSDEEEARGIKHALDTSYFEGNVLMEELKKRIK